jgi:hypothetical protein
MNDKYYKIAKILAAVLGLVGIIMLVRVLGTDTETLTTDAEVQASVIDPFISFTIAMLYITTGISVLFSIWNLVKHPAALKKALISLVALGVLFFLAYSMATGAEVTGAGGVSIEGGEAGSTPKMVGALIKYTYILGIIGLATVVWGSFTTMFSNK